MSDGLDFVPDEEELFLLDAYRKMTPYEQEAIRLILGIEPEPDETEKE